MSKIFFTVSFYHDGPHRRPQFSISTINGYNIQMQGLDLKSLSFGNSNLGDGFRHRFEYLVGGGPSFTRLSLVMNTSAILPQMSWAAPHPSGPPRGKGPRGPPQKRRDKESPSEFSSRRSSIDHNYRQPKALTRSSSNPSLRHDDHITSQRLIDSAPYSERAPRPKRISYSRNEELYDDEGDWGTDRAIEGDPRGNRDRRLRERSRDREPPRSNSQRQSSRNHPDDDGWDDYLPRGNMSRRKSKHNNGGESFGCAS